MDVVALSPVLASRLVWRRDEARWALTVVVKATFELVPGEVRPSNQLAPVYGADVHEGGNTAHALIAPNDLVPFKGRADVLLVGHAYAPHGRPVSSLVTRLAVGGVDKSIVVHGNRMVSPRGVGPALPFAKMSLSYDRASGGPGTSNPVGIPRGDRLPNLEPLGFSAARTEGKPGAPASGMRVDTAPPVGFGPIAPAWPERASRQRAWRMDEPLPEDFDAGFFNAAPADQQTAFFRGDETIVLDHLHPDHATLATRLPGLVPRVIAERARHGATPVDVLADTLWIDTDRRKVCVVWRGELSLASRDEAGRVLVAMTSAREPMTYEGMIELYRALSGAGAEPGAGDDEEAEAEDELLSTAAVPVARIPRQDRAERLGHLSALPSFDDEESVDAGGAHLDGSTQMFEVPVGARIPDASPAWLASPSRADAAQASRSRAATARGPGEELAAPEAAGRAHPVPSRGPLPEHPSAREMRQSLPRNEPAAPGRPPTLASYTAPLAPPENAPPLDLVWDGPAERPEPKTLPPPALAEGLPFLHAEGAASPEASPDVRTGPLPVVALAPAASLASAPEPASPWASGLDPSSAAASAAPAPMPSAVVVRPEPPPEPPRPERRVTYRAPSEAVDLVWFDPASVPRVAARFRDLVDELDMEPLDPAHDLPVDDPVAARDRHHVFGVLTRAPVTEPRGVPAAVRAATDAHGRFTPPLVVMEGDLVFGLDDRAVLKTTAACARPLAKDNKRLQDVLANVDEALETPLFLGAAGASDSLLREVLSAAAASKRAVPAKVLEEHVERLLLSERAYQLRSVLGGPQIRAALVPARESSALVSYLPEPVGPKLPLSLRFRARIVAEVHPSPDPQEPAPLALRVVAIGRVVQVPGRA